jgi:hypothetical protein
MGPDALAFENAQHTDMGSAEGCPAAQCQTDLGFSV